MRRSISMSGCLWAATLVMSPGEPAVVESIQGKIFRPAVLDPTAERIAKLKIAAGFKISVFAKDLKAPRMMAVSTDGHVYVTRRAPQNDVILIRQDDGKSEPPVTVASIKDVHGIALKGNKLYLSAVREVFVADIRKDGTLGDPVKLYNDLPDAGQHPNRTLAFGPDGRLFLSVGSTCNACPEPNTENATMLEIKPDGSGRSVVATGLRNTIGFDWHPETGGLYGMDHGIDWLGDETQLEELNLIASGKNYGWPYVFENGKPNPADDPKKMTGMTWEKYAATCEAPLLTETAHSAPMALLFYQGSEFPANCRGDAFVTFHGSWNRGEASGYKVMRLKFKESKPTEFEDFLTGFYVPGEKGQFGRPCGLALMPDGSMLLSDDGSGIIYRITGM